ncbi:hypothetical protein GW17_00008281 [Ensete ventricosum]|nr:hypothetical protein GW17_00008281 [Ensete ventricosum]
MSREVLHTIHWSVIPRCYNTMNYVIDTVNQCLIYPCCSGLGRCIPYKLNREDDTGSDDLLDRVEVLMITSPGRHDLIFPKWSFTFQDTVLGVWEFRSKSTQDTCSLEGACRGYMFALEVTEELECYPEKDCHERKWVSNFTYSSICC